ncbi:MAG TPA: lyase family protein [Planctomycetota bacterium]|nr:lyase family protein [Planctomycetota bacterium]
MTTGDWRIERDPLGEVRVAATALYGAQTARAAAWSFSGQVMPAALVHALGRIKAAAARVHGAAGRLPPAIASAIERAAREVADGAHDGEFVVDVFQTGSATSTNMNANEVIANRAAELLGAARGGNVVHPNDHVNLAQSSNDVMPSAVQLAAVTRGEQRLLPALAALVERLHALAGAHWSRVRDGRTHLMRAMPIRFGQQFRGAAQHVAAARRRLAAAIDECRALPLGGTAVGTGVNAPPGFAAAVCAAIRSESGVAVHETEEHLAAQDCLDGLTALAATMGTAATTLYKLVNDLRWQASTAFEELVLPELQPGSSQMPGKVNPVVCEAVLMVCAQVQGNAGVVAFANSQGQFELNTMIPVVARNVLESIDLLAGAATTLRERCLDGLRLGDAPRQPVGGNPMLATALAPEIGYDAAAAIARRAAHEHRSVLELAREMTGLDAAHLQQLLDPARLSGGPEQPPPSPPRR